MESPESNKTEIHIVPELSKTQRLQEYGVGIFQLASTKSALKKVLKKQYIEVDGQVATTATYIHGGETISLKIPEATKARKELIFPLKVLFEDEYLAIIHKPAGILVSGNSFKTIAHALEQNLKKSSLPDATIPQPVHRLDYPTTGLLLVGKTSSSIQALNKIFEEKKVQKSYYAVAIGKMDQQGQIDSVVDGKASRSNFIMEDSVFSEKYEQLNLLKLEPETGRRHQLRIHLSGIGNPILGDQQYGKEGLILKGKGLYLHAFSLDFEHPFSQEVLHFEDELPVRFKKLFS